MHEHERELVGVGDTYTAQELLKAFRGKALTMHPDVGGSSEDFVRLQEAYKELLRYAVPDLESGEKILKTVSGVPLSDLGRGFPLNQSAKTCESCDGRGWQKFPGHRQLREVDCASCQGSGLVFYPCKKCGGTGKYIHPKTQKEVGECWGCKGSGRYYPFRKKSRNQYRPWFASFQRVRYVPGTQTPGVECSVCMGAGVVRELVEEEGGYIYNTCDACKGVGEIKLWNQVIPRGFLVSKGQE